MHTGQRASSHSFTRSSLSEGFMDNDCLEQLELQGKGDALDLSEDTERFLLSLGMFRCQISAQTL